MSIFTKLQSRSPREKLVRQNCWEFKKCGRQPGGENVGHLGVCPAARDNDYNGKNGGKFAGRFCWAVAGTFCDGVIQGIFAKKLEDCISCDFLKQVYEEEKQNFIF